MIEFLIGTFMSLMALVGIVSTLAVLVVFGPDLWSACSCRLLGHAWIVQNFGARRRCARCEKED